ncbi:MAG: tetratricopeptide (TPR) repeat protein, partial [Planctomycetota bacterium]
RFAERPTPLGSLPPSCRPPQVAASTMRQYALLLFLCGCTTLSSDQLDRLEICQRNAPLYFDGDKLGQALIQVERGLEIDPDDYKLNVIKGAVLLRASERNPKMLDQATGILERVYDWRSPMRHEPYELFYYGLARQKQGLRHLGEAIRLEDRSARSPETKRHDEFADKAVQERTAAINELRKADELLSHLIERGELLRMVHNHRLQIARQLGDDKLFEQSAEAFLKQMEEERKVVDADVKRTVIPDYEAQQYRYLLDLKEEELDVRALYADWLFHRKNFDRALEQMNFVVKLDPTRSDNYYNRGRVHMELKNVEDAKSDFRTFLATSQLPSASSKKTFATKALTR